MFQKGQESNLSMMGITNSVWGDNPLNGIIFIHVWARDPNIKGGDAPLRRAWGNIPEEKYGIKTPWIELIYITLLSYYHY